MARAVEFDEAQAVQKAMHVFWEKGYTATSVRDLTEAMQINISSLYNTLGDKRQLFIKALQQYTRLRMQAFERYDTTAESPFRTLATFINDAVHTLTTEPNSCMCVRTAFEIEGDDPEIQAVITAYDEFAYHFLKKLLERAQAHQEIARHTDAATIADYINSAFAGWYNAYLLHGDRKKIQDIADFMLQQLKA
ncbi:TetR/AcrR family transcriptional regulator [Hymenobacter terrenus]|uniref:TetR/AcrR family transcriptional regulator n=1 Tax=Hymenobacter terrenus TaxID=1629124 RepID=UPI000619DD15|nr:TetR/AcrR family transcriptional regulator [Hymenobacter terrenus]